MFAAIFKRAPAGALVEIAPGRLETSHRKYLAPSDAIALLDRPSEENDAERTDWFYAPCWRKERGATREDVWGTQVLWADIDRDQPIPYATLPPSFVVFSGRGWHYYWLLDEPLTDIASIEALNKLLVADVDGDSACTNSNRMLRMPGTVNSRSDKTCELRQAPAHVYSIGDIRVLEKLDSKARHKIRTGDRRGYKSRSERDWAIIESLVVSGADDALIFKLFALQPCGDKFRDPETNAVHYLNHTIQQVKEKSISVVRGRRQISDLSEGDDGYYLERARGRQRISTFVFRPRMLLTGSDGAEDVLVCDVVSNGFTWANEKMPRSAFNDRRSLDKHLTVAAWVWLGRDDDVRQLLPYLMKQLQDVGMPKTKAASVLGRVGDYFVLNTQTVARDGLYEGTDAPVVFVDRGRECPVMRVPSSGTLPSEALADLLTINQPGVVWPAIGWFCASTFKPQVEAAGLRFPILNVYGTRGSGKTTLLKTMQRLLGYEVPKTYDCTTTRFVMLSLLGSTNAVPVCFSEYRQAVAERVIRFVLLAYDTGHDPRGRPDQTTIDYPLTAPFTVDGEDVINDAACKERIIALNMAPETIAEGTPAYKAFARVRELELERFALPYYQHILAPGRVHEAIIGGRRAVADDFSEPLPDRIRNNMAVTMAGVLTFCSFAGLNAPTAREVFGSVLGNVWNEKMGRTSMLVDEFCEGLVNVASAGKADFFYTVDKQGVVWFQLAPAFAWWSRTRRLTGVATLDRDAIRNQLNERDVEKGGKGQYIFPPKNVESRWCYGISLEKASEAGLDIPTKLGRSSITFTL